MAGFDFVNGTQVSISDSNSAQVHLNAQEAIDLLQWLSDHKDVLLALAQRDHAQALSEKHLEILLYQEDLEYLDQLKAAIPDLHERQPIKVLDARLDTLTERALQLIKELQLEYTVHPLLLEDHEAYAQG